MFGNFTAMFLYWIALLFSLYGHRIGSGTLILFNKCVVFEVQVPILFFQLICAYLYPLSSASLYPLVLVGGVSCPWVLLPKDESKGLYFRKVPNVIKKKKKKLSSALCDLINLQYVHQYASFSDMLGAESLAKVLPDVETIEEGNNFYLYWVSLPVCWYNLSGKWLELKFGHAAENILVTIKNQNFVVHNSNRNSNCK